MIRTILIATTGTLAAALLATPAAATVTVHNVSGTFTDGKVLGGSFTYDDSVANGGTGNAAAGYSSIALTIDGVLLSDVEFVIGVFSSTSLFGLDKGFATNFTYANAIDPGLPNSLTLTFDAASASDFAKGILSSGALTGRNGMRQVGGEMAYATLTSSAATTVTPAVAAVPEPATWALMLMGFGLTGAALRRRPRTHIHTRVTYA